ncbi:protealysin inhibitor emfourin [Saccharicrinis sp. GN24d3]|uniref:protealysin inhibitor emfourin n=1 Tax=Saccharicrinis sp. GN24d3 TaxID=3458416 RepID=UPI004036968D
MADNYKIIYERSGGLMGQTISCELNSDELPEELRSNFINWLELTNADGSSGVPETDAYPDQFQYILTVKGKHAHAFTFSESNLPKDLISMFNFLNRKARKK